LLQLLSAPAATHALSSSAARGFGFPPGGMFPPNHPRHEFVVLAIGDCVPVM
jgi:hypothetical protein